MFSILAGLFSKAKWKHNIIHQQVSRRFLLLVDLVLQFQIKRSKDLYHGAANLNFSYWWQCYQTETGRTKYIVWFLFAKWLPISIHYCYSIRGTWPRWRQPDNGLLLDLSHGSHGSHCKRVYSNLESNEPWMNIPILKTLQIRHFCQRVASLHVTPLY